MTNWEIKEIQKGTILVTAISAAVLAILWFLAGFEWMVAIGMIAIIYLLLSLDAGALIRAQGTNQLFQALLEKVDEQAHEISRLEGIIDSRIPRSLGSENPFR